MRAPLIPVLLVAACVPPDPGALDDDVVHDTPIAWCEGSTTWRWDPLNDRSLGLFPDPVWTRPDPSSPTGLRLDAEGAAFLAEMPVGVVELAAPLGDLSGFARIGAAVLRFDAPVGEVPADAATSVVDDGLLFVELTPDGPVRVPYRASVGEDGTQLLVQPLRVLAPGAPHAVVLTTAHVAADGGCVAPSPVLRGLLEGGSVDARVAAHRPAYLSALADLGIAPGDVSAMTVFTTHDDVRLLEEAAVDAASHTYAWDAAPTCEDAATHRRCSGTFTAHDYRTGDAVLGSEPQDTWSIGVDLWLPTDGGPAPVLMVGHGMSGRRQDVGSGALDLVEAGFAVVAADALFHGDHPTTEGIEPGGMAFLGFDLDVGEVSLRRVRGSFVQTPLDGAQVRALLRDVPDVDGDGVDDVDPSRGAYLGISLGGLLGPGQLVAHPATGAGVLQIAGGHLVVFVTETGLTGEIQPLLEGLAGGPDGLDRFLALGQTAIDPADPAVIAAHVTGDQAGPDAPDLLLQVARYDDVVPPPTGEMLARGLGAPALAPRVWAVDALPEGPPRAAPVVGYQQFDQITRGGVLQDAGHHTTHDAPEVVGQLMHFLDTWRTTGTAEIVPWERPPAP